MELSDYTDIDLITQILPSEFNLGNQYYNLCNQRFLNFSEISFCLLPLDQFINR